MNYKIENDITLKEGDGTSKEVVNMSEKILLAEIRDLYSSNNCEDVIEKSIKKIYKILKRSDINSAFKNSFRKKVDIPIHKIFKDRIEYFTTDYIDTLTNAYTILFILTKYLRYLENDDLKYNVIHSESTTLFTIFEFIKENGISCQTSEDYYSLIVLYDNLNNMTVKDIKLDFLKKCDVKHPKDVLKIINGEKTEEQRDMLSFNVNSTDKHESSVFRKIRRRNSKVPFAIYLSLLLCVLTILSCAIPPYIPQLSLILSSAAFAITAMVEPNEDLANGDSDARSTSQGVTLVKNSQNSNALSTKILDGRGDSTESRYLAKNSTSTQNNLDVGSDLAKDYSTDKHESNVFYKIRHRIFKTLFIIILFLLLCVFVAFGYAISLQFIPFLGLAVCGIFSATRIIKELTNDDSDVRSTLTENSTSTQNNLNADSNLAQVSSTDAEASYNAVSYVNIQLLLDKIERNIQKGYKFRNIDIARYRNIYFKEIVNNCKTDNLPKTTIDGYAKVLNSLLDDMYDAELESNILESNAALATLQSLTQIDGIQKDSIQDFCVNRSQEAVESINDSESTDDSEFTNDSASDN